MTYRPFDIIIGQAYDLVMANITNDPSILKTTLKNNSGSSIAELSAIYIDGNGDIDKVDVSNENTITTFIGITQATIANASTGPVALQGRIANITTSFNFGDYVYVSAVPGILTNILPAVGSNGFVSGDFLIRVGVIAKNSSNPLQKDLLIDLEIIGQL